LKDKKTYEKDEDRALHLLGAFWNVNYLFKHIKYFEKKIPKEIESLKKANSKSLSQCHNFAAWIRLYTEYICVRMFFVLNWTELCEKLIRDYRYRPALIEVISQAKKSTESLKVSKGEFRSKELDLKRIIELRHSFQHGGAPNIIRELKLEGIDYSDVYSMIIPQNYMKTKIIFESADELLNMVPAPSLKAHVGDANQDIEENPTEEYGREFREEEAE